MPPRRKNKPGKGKPKPAPVAPPMPPMPPPTGYEALSAGDRDWVDELTTLFTNNGLGALAGRITSLVQENYTGSALTLKLQESDEYKTRFAANEARRKAGIPVLSPREYLATENAYRQVMAEAGMPTGFYDDPADFTDFLAADKSPAEIKARVDSAAALAKRVEPGFRKMLSDTFGMGLTDGDLAAYFLDPGRALPLLERQVNSVTIADAARKQGLSYSADRSYALADAGVTGAVAERAYGQIAEATSGYGRAAAAFGTDYSQTDAEDELLTGLASAKRKRLATEGAFTAYNSGGSTAAKGAHKRDDSGSY